ncbi:hypothetical protein ACA910_021966 [Epithemia clementina (nom. ined.)]
MYQQSATSSNSYYPNYNSTQPLEASRYPAAPHSFIAAPAPVLLDDGDITVVSALTTTTTRPGPYYNVSTTAPRRASYSAPMNTPVQEKEDGPPRTISTSSTSSLNQDANRSLVVADNFHSRPRANPASASWSPGYATSPNVVESRTISTTITTYNVPAENQLTTYAGTENQIVTYQPPRGPHKTYPAEVEKMKIRRKRATIAAGVTGGLVGLIALGPVGAVVGGAGASMATRSIGKRRERKKREKIAQRAIAEQERDAPEVLVHSGAFL